MRWLIWRLCIAGIAKPSNEGVHEWYPVPESSGVEAGRAIRCAEEDRRKDTWCIGGPEMDPDGLYSDCLRM